MMNKKFKYYALIWAILLAVFNTVVFLARPVIPGYEIRYDSRFWIAWAFIIGAFAGNLVCAYLAFKSEDLRKTFYNISLISVSYTGLILTIIFGILLMLIPDCPAWITAIVCVIVFAFTAIAVIKAKAASDVVEDIDNKVKAQTLFVKSLTVDAESLLVRAATPEAKDACKKVYEAVRYSDPMSNDALAGVESQITLKFNEFSSAVTSGADGIGNLANELVVLIGDRNEKCKLLK